MTTVESYLAWCRQNGSGTRINKTLAQRQEELKTSKKAKVRKQTQSSIDEHIEALELNCVEAYQTWCRANGIGAGLQ